MKLLKNLPLVGLMLAILCVASPVWACMPCRTGFESPSCLAVYGLLSLFLTWVGAGVAWVYLVAAHRRVIGWVRIFGYTFASYIFGALALTLTVSLLQLMDNPPGQDLYVVAAFAETIVVQVGLAEFLARRRKARLD